MITDKIVPAYIIRLYLWEILRENEALELVSGKVPIIPLEDEPELSDAGKPYAIYGYSENEAIGIDAIRRGTFAFRVIATTSGQLDRIQSIVGRAFEDCDIATEGLNRFSTQFGTGELVGIRFTYAKTSYVMSAEPSETEAGPVEGVITIAYSYINHLPIPIPDTATGGLWT